MSISPESSDREIPGAAGRRPSPAPIERKAAEWLALREARGFTAAEHASFAEWCARDPRHPAIFAELERAWRAFDRLEIFPHSIDQAADPDLLVPSPPARRRVWITRTTLLAASLALAATLWFQPWQSTSTVAAVGEAGRRLTFPDGSKVELNAGAEVQSQFTAAERRVALVSGEAHFEVARDAARPFVVQAGGVAVRAIGTAFNVRLAAGQIEVLVTEGKVQVQSPPLAVAAATEIPLTSAEVSQALTLTSGERTVFEVDAATGRLGQPTVDRLLESEINQRLAWQRGRLIFDATPLAEAVARIGERSHRPRLILGDDKVGQILLSGHIRADNVESFVEGLEIGFGVTAERRADGVIVLRKAR